MAMLPILMDIGVISMIEIECSQAKKPEFKPGNKPYLVFGNEILNNNIPWSEVLRDLVIKVELTVIDIAAQLETTVGVLKTLLKTGECGLGFKQAARLLTIHDKYFNDCKNKERCH